MRYEISEVVKKDQVMELVFGNCSKPKDLLGRHFILQGQVISAYHPDAVKMEVISEDGEHYPMDTVERQPVFSLFLPHKRPFSYQIHMTFHDGNTYISSDPYSYEGLITEEEEKLFSKGNWTEVYHKMGCHKVKLGNTEGMYFAVWAPGARRVSVVGDFNYWNGMLYPMHKMENSDIFELFIPGLSCGQFYKFEIKNVKDYDKDKDGDFIKEVIIKNEQPTGTIKLDKTISVREDADISLIDTSDLSGIEFKLSAKENIIDMSDGSVIYEKGQEIKKYNLTKDGKLEITNLPIGTYEIEETKTLNGLVLNTTKYEVKFEQKDLTTKVYTEKLDISNDTTLVEFSKTDITGDKELKGAKLSVLDSDNKVIDEWISTDKTHKIEGLVVGKEYILKEEIAPEGYVIATSVKFTIDDTNKIQKINMKDKVVSMSKTDIGGNEVEGAKIQIIDKDGNIVDEWISTKEEHKIKNLIENETYTLHEETAPNGFVKATDVTFKVTDEKKDQRIELINKVVEVTKTDLTNGNELEGAELEVIDENGDTIDKWTSAKEPHQVKGLEEGKTYVLKETTAPYGYEITEEIMKKIIELAK